MGRGIEEFSPENIETYEGSSFYNFKSLKAFLLNDSIARQIKEKLSSYSPTAQRTFTLSVDANLKKVKNQLSKLGKVFELEKSDSRCRCFIFGENRVFCVYITVKNILCNLDITIFFQEKDFKKGIEEVEKNAKKDIEEELSNLIIKKPTVIIKWKYYAGDYCKSRKMVEVLDDKVYPEAYPDIELDRYLNRYLHSQETVLLIRGRPGTGKTRLIRYILKKIWEKKESLEISFTNQKMVIKESQIFEDFISKGEDLLILEDMDEALTERNAGNRIMSTILNAADGVVRSGKKGKIIMTTNLPNIDHIDEALLRPGRCFDVLELEALNAEEGEILLEKLGCSAKLDTEKNYTLAELYEIANKGESKQRTNREMGFRDETNR